MERLVILGVLMCCGVCMGYKSFQSTIPNGDNVPHPCYSDIWPGVGHRNYRGSGERNPFGVDFKANNYKWNKTICNKDSDGDGKSNGQELGDPECKWLPGEAPSRADGLSHPGICEPLDSERCGATPDWIQCTDTGFNCPAVNEAETFNFTVRIPEQAVPAVETTYICMSFEFPTDQEYHMVANKPHIDNIDVMHHIVLYGCKGLPETTLNTPYNCDMGADKGTCGDIIGVWAVGIDGDCMHSQAGFLIGGASGYKYGAFQFHWAADSQDIQSFDFNSEHFHMLQFHWNNPLAVPNYVDSSGMIIYLTPKLRPHNAGVFVIGQSRLDIPPGQDNHEAVGKCGGQCTKDMITDKIHVSSVFNHMHYLGHAQITELRRDNKMVSMLAEDSTYSYSSPVTHSYKDAITVLPGDEVKTKCVFSSKNKTRTTYFGDATSDEMCLSFITYFPKERMSADGRCVSWKNIDWCELRSPVIQGCNSSVVFNPMHPETAAIQKQVKELCHPSSCRLECLNFVKELKKTPCYRGDVSDIMRLSIDKIPDETLRLKTYYHYASMDSCDVEIACDVTMEHSETSVATTVIPGCVLLLVLLGALI